MSADAASATGSDGTTDGTADIPVSLTAETSRTLSRMVAEAQREWRSPGVSAGLVRDGRLVWSEHVGFARLDPETPGTDDTQYLIGSVTKTFTAVLVLILRDEGRLSLDAPLSTYLPQTRHGAVSLRQLLAHASGLQREPVGRIWESLDAPDEERLLRELEQAEQVLEPHVAFHYSNLAFALLGNVVERCSGAPWSDVVRQRLLEPLGMTRTGLVPDERLAATGYLVHPHAATATPEPLFELRATAPLGGLWSTVADLARYAAFVADPPESVLAPATLAEMATPMVMADTEGWLSAYGLGFALTRAGERVLVGHGGAMPGYLTGLQVRRAEKVGAVVFANSSAGAASVELATRLVTTVLDAEPAVPEPWRPSQPHPELDGVLGSWWSEGEECVFEVREDQLWCRVPSAPGPRFATRFERESDDVWRAVEGRERGERLEVARDADGAVTRMYFATYPFTRMPTGFGTPVG